MMLLEKVIETDVLVIGGGIAGIFAAIKARQKRLDVTLVDKGYVGKSGSSAFAGGYFALFNPEWGHNLYSWLDQISKTGEYINNREWSDIVLKDSYGRYQDLVSWGVEFVEENGKLVKNYHPPALESVNMWRRKYMPVMRNQALESGINILDRIMVTDLLKQDGKVVGAIGFNTTSGHLYTLKAKATVLSAGSSSFKPAGMPVSFLTSDAEAMAFRAGAEITGKEFVDRHITMAAFPAWRGHGQTMVRFRKFIDAECQELNPIFRFADWDYAVHAGRAPIFWNLDVATPEDIKSMLQHQKVTGTNMEAKRVGLDVNRGGKVPMVGGASAGSSGQQTAGIWPINTKCATNLPGLYAAGNCCATRQIGAVYPGTGFGLCGSAVTGARSGLGAAEYALKTKKIMIDEAKLASSKKILYAPMERKGGFSPGWVTQVLQNFMIPYFILEIKHGERMQAALTLVEFLGEHLVPKLTAKDAHELRMAQETKNMVLSAEMMLRASIFRTESRGSHYREDYPRRDDPNWLAWVKLKEEQGRMKLWKEPIPKEWWPDSTKPYEERYPIRFPGE